MPRRPHLYSIVWLTVIASLSLPAVVAIAISGEAQSAAEIVAGRRNTPLIQQPRLILASDQSGGVRGLGLQGCIVRVWAAEGSRFAGHTVHIQTTKGRLNRSSVTLGPAGTAEFELRSEGLGSAEVTAGGKPFADASTTVNFAFPFAFVLSAFAGAMLAALLLERATTLLSPLAFGLAGVTMAAAFANQSSYSLVFPRGEAVAFAVSFICAYLGIAILAKLFRQRV
jgi:hypothetical protein